MLFQTFQQRRGKVCGKAGSYSCNLLLRNRVQTTCTATGVAASCRCGRWQAGEESDPSENASRQVAAGFGVGIVARARAGAHSRRKEPWSTGRRLLRQAQRSTRKRPCACWAPALRDVSRGGLKLEKALEHGGFDPQGRICLDIGASTGGFSDCMLRHGAARVSPLIPATARWI